MTIDAANGRASFPEIGVALDPTLTRARFLRLSVAAQSRTVAHHEPFYRSQLPVVPQRDTELYVVLQFHSERLLALELFHSAARFGNSWDEWTEARELTRKAFHEHWLASELHLSCGQYRWGEISSNYDPRSGISALLINYKGPNVWQTVGRKAGRWWGTTSQPR